MFNKSTCRRCGKDFLVPTKLRRHQARKTPCAPILEPEDLPPEIREDPAFDQKQCRFCGRVFSSYTSMRRHVRQSCKIAPNAKNGGEGMDVLYEHTIRKQEARIATLERQNEEMLGMMRQLVIQTGAPGTQSVVNSGAQTGEVAIVGNDAQVDNSKHIHINIFGREDVRHIGITEIKGILDEVRPLYGDPAVAAAQVVTKTAMLIYSDPDHPENLTCYIPNKRGADALVHGDAGWEVRPVDLVLPPMASTSIDAICGHQPLPGLAGCEEMIACDEYEAVYKELVANEKNYAAGKAIRPVLIRNKNFLARALEHLPIAGGT